MRVGGNGELYLTARTGKENKVKGLYISKKNYELMRTCHKDYFGSDFRQVRKIEVLNENNGIVTFTTDYPAEEYSMPQHEFHSRFMVW